MVFTFNKARPPAVTTTFLPRLRIWQIEAGRHCSVLGTCLSLNDLHVIARRAGYQVDPSTSAYKLHSSFVDMMGSPNELSKLVDKELEKRHGKAADAVRRARTGEEIEARWKDVAARGHIAGAFWGAMSHPLCSEELQWTLFGEIHMLSHLVGASRRSDLARVHELEGVCAALDGKLAQLKHDHRALLKERKTLDDDLALQRREAEQAARRLAISQGRVAALESATLTRQLEIRNAELERQLREAHERASTAEASLADTRALVEELRAAGTRVDGQVRELSIETEALESELAASIAGRIVDGQEHETEEELGGLSGMRILCVGGRVGLVPHYRALVERRGGELLHHDGGVEDSMDAVTRALDTVDVVVCPVDCVSHGACLKVKKACKQLAIQFVPLRSSGLSSLARLVRELAARRGASPSRTASARS